MKFKYDGRVSQHPACAEARVKVDWMENNEDGAQRMFNDVVAWERKRGLLTCHLMD